MTGSKEDHTAGEVAKKLDKLNGKTCVGLQEECSATEPATKLNELTEHSFEGA